MHAELAGLTDRGGETARSLADLGLSPDATRSMLDNLLQGQSVMLATNQVMTLVAAVFVCAAFVIWLAPRPGRAVDMSQAGH
jgi:DHA2 family multidrug resistance protein